MSSEKEVTIYDIAKVLNLSPATVSRALKNNPLINVKTRKKITDLAKEMGYRSNTFASNLRRQQTNTIGVIVHELNSHFITSVLAGIEKITTENGYDIIIGHSSESYKKETANTHNLFHKRVDGLIASLAYNTEDLSHFDPFIQKGIPVVFFDRVEETHAGIKIVIDNLKAGFDATSHLIEQGCKNIAHVTGNLKRNVYADRLEGYKRALLQHGLLFKQNKVIVNDLSEDASMQAARQLLKMRPAIDGVFITNDFCAAVIMQTLKDEGKSIPADIAVVGFNNDVISKIVEPKLTTVNYPGFEMGEITARNLLGQLTGSITKGLTDTIFVQSDLVIRASSLKKKVKLFPGMPVMISC